MLVVQVNHALMSAQVDGYAGLRITATDGDVTLEGTLATQELIDDALRIARTLAGVKSVTSRVAVAESRR